jgi:hypothetical protein
MKCTEAVVMDDNYQALYTVQLHKNYDMIQSRVWRNLPLSSLVFKKIFTEKNLRGNVFHH